VRSLRCPTVFVVGVGVVGVGVVGVGTMKSLGLLALGSAVVTAATGGLSTGVLADGYHRGGGAPVYSCASNAITAANNQISVDYASQHVDYVEFNPPAPFNGGQAVGIPIDSEKGWVHGISGTASAMFNLGSICNVYVLGRISYFKGDTDYWQNVGPIGQSGAKIIEGDFRLGKGFNVAPNVMLTPYFGGGLRRWDRDVCASGACQAGGYHEHYEHGYLGGGLLAQISPVSRLVLSLSGLVGRTLDSEINGHAVPGGAAGIIPFHASLGNSTIYKVESSADFAFTSHIHGNVGVEYTNFKYGESAPFVFTAAGGTAVEPDSKTSNVTIRVGLGIAFGGDRAPPLK
jgi:hypothetical protein